MANMCSIKVFLKIPKLNLKDFLKSLDFDSDVFEYVPGTYLEVLYEENLEDEKDVQSNNENVFVELFGECRHSCYSAWKNIGEDDKYPHKKLVKLVDVLKKYEVISFRGYGIEEGICFVETFFYQLGEKDLTIKCFDY